MYCFIRMSGTPRILVYLEAFEVSILTHRPVLFPSKFDCSPTPMCYVFNVPLKVASHSELLAIDEIPFRLKMFDHASRRLQPFAVLVVQK